MEEMSHGQSGPVAANRRNAAKSSGPKTAEGKAVVAQNALRHGLTAEQLVLFDEIGADFAAFHGELRATYQPTDAVEEELVERIVVCAWRLRRAARVEAALMTRGADTSRREWEARDLGRACAYMLHDLAALSRHESVLDRVLRRAQMLLERRQAQRRGEAVLPPLAVAIAGIESADESTEKVKIDKTKPISESLPAGMEPEGAIIAPHPSPLPANGEREGPASAGR
jgi:hypothetical protein